MPSPPTPPIFLGIFLARPSRRPAMRRKSVPRCRLGVERLEPRAVFSAGLGPSTADVINGREWANLGPLPAAEAVPDSANDASLAAPSIRAVVTPLAVQRGPIVHAVKSPFQRTVTHIRILLPDGYDPTLVYRTIYLLPVEPGSGTRYGDSLRVVQQANLHNKHQIVFVAPTFSDMPWYADHASHPGIRQESHLVRFVIPFVEQRYAVAPVAADRLLLGFSKSGYGAFSLLLRNPDVFGKAYSWDSPIAMSNPATPWGSMPIYGSRANFSQYHVSRLLRQQAPMLAGGPPRLYLGGYSVDSFRSHHAQTAALMRSLHIPHGYDTGRFRGHAWTSGWVPSAVAWLAS